MTVCVAPRVTFGCVCGQAMESKLLEGGKTIMDHTNEQQKLLEQKRQEIAEQVRKHLIPTSAGDWSQ